VTIQRLTARIEQEDINYIKICNSLLREQSIAICSLAPPVNNVRDSVADGSCSGTRMAGAIWAPKDSEAALAHLTVLLPGVTAWAEQEGLTRAEQPELDSGFRNCVTILLTAQFPGEIIQ
jgi:hypothetical protein